MAIGDRAARRRQVAALLLSGAKLGKQIEDETGMLPSEAHRILSELRAEGLIEHGYVLTRKGRTTWRRGL